MSAEPEPEISLAEALQLARAEGLIALAGLVAARRALRGSEPGWRRFRSSTELKAFHECGHAIVALVLGKHVYGLSIVADATVRMGKSGILGGFAFIGRGDEPINPQAEPAGPMETDIQTVCKWAQLYEDPATWRAMRRTIRAWRVEAAAIVEDNWYLLQKLAGELERRQTMNRSEIGAIVGRA